MITKAMIALYRYRIAVSKGEDKADALVRSVESVAENWFEYVDIYNYVKGVI